MKNGTALCIPYFYYTSPQTTRKSYYRIADLEEGKYIPVKTAEFSDDPDNFSPRFIRVLQADESPAYVPCLNSWTLVHTTYDRWSTESTPSYDFPFYELVLPEELTGGSERDKMQALRTGITLPEGASEHLLLALYVEEDSYYTVYCRKSYFKELNGKYYLHSDLNNMRLVRHSLNVFDIPAEDVFDTTSYPYLYKEDGSRAPIRRFYAYTELPEQDGRFDLYTLDEYVPFFLARYIRGSAQSGFTKSQVRDICKIAQQAFEDKEAVASFFSFTGYSEDEVCRRLGESAKTIVAYLQEHDQMDSVIEGILRDSDSLTEAYTLAGKNLWLREQDQDREAAEANLDALQRKVREQDLILEVQDRQIGECNAKLVNLENEISKAKALEEHWKTHLEAVKEEYARAEELEREAYEKRYLALQQEEEEAKAAFAQVTEGLKTNLMDYIAKGVAYQGLLGPATASASANTPSTAPTTAAPTLAAATPATFTFEQGERNHAAAWYECDNYSKATKALKHNLMASGMGNHPATVLPYILLECNRLCHSLIIPGYAARNIAEAISMAMDATRPAKASCLDHDIDYPALCDALREYDGKVVLVENLLDLCNDVLLASLNKDFPEKLFIFSVESDDVLAMLPKGIWNYCIYVDMDVEKGEYKPEAMKASQCAEFLKDTVPTIGSIPEEACEALEKLGISKYARMRMTRIFDPAPTENIAAEGLLWAFIDKLCSIYSASMDADVLQEIRDAYTDEIDYQW